MKQLSELVELAKLANIAGQGTPEMVEFRVTANPDAIIAIAAAFRSLEQEAQKNLEGAFAWQNRAEAAEAKLAERNKQRNPDYFLNRIESSDKWGPEVELRIYESQLDASKSQDDHGGGIIELFTRPAPAADLVPEGWKLVPVEPTKQMLEASYREASVYSPTAYRAMLAAAPTPNE